MKSTAKITKEEIKCGFKPLVMQDGYGSIIPNVVGQEEVIVKQISGNKRLLKVKDGEYQPQTLLNGKDSNFSDSWTPDGDRIYDLSEI